MIIQPKKSGDAAVGPVPRVVKGDMARARNNRKPRGGAKHPNTTTAKKEKGEKKGGSLAATTSASSNELSACSTALGSLRGLQGTLAGAAASLATHAREGLLSGHEETPRPNAATPAMDMTHANTAEHADAEAGVSPRRCGHTIPLIFIFSLRFFLSPWEVGCIMITVFGGVRT